MEADRLGISPYDHSPALVDEIRAIIKKMEV
jgi:hypothetical protein